MRGRKPKPVKLKRKDVTELECLLHDGHTLQRVAQRARILLARADGAGVAAVAAKADQDPPRSGGCASATPAPPAEQVRVAGTDYKPLCAILPARDVRALFPAANALN